METSRTRYGILLTVAKEKKKIRNLGVQQPSAGSRDSVLQKRFRKLTVYSFLGFVGFKIHYENKRLDPSFNGLLSIKRPPTLNIKRLGRLLDHIRYLYMILLQQCIQDKRIQ